jgi:hypothetical protein
MSQGAQKSLTGSRAILAAATVALLLPVASSAQFITAPMCPIDADGRIADVFHDRNAISFRPILDHQALILTVRTPCSVWVKQFDRGEDPVFTLEEVPGDVEGSYRWELELVPIVDAGVAKALAKAREEGDLFLPLELQQKGLLPKGPVVDSGAFAVVDGSIVDPKLEERSQGKVTTVGSRAADLASAFDPTRQAQGVRIAAADQVIPDDLIVQGSLCVGFDCVNNESFSFDTIRMKENNLRIDFTDTSVGSFPTQDWEIAANDSASGGRSALIVSDQDNQIFVIESGSVSNALYLDSTARIGLRTSTPVLDLHIATSNTPGIRLEQTSAGGFTAQTWDIAGNEANFFVRDVTGGSRLPFRIRPDAPTSSIDISSDGDVGIGTASPDNPLHVFSDSASFVAALNLENEGGDVGFRLTNDVGTMDLNLVDNAGVQEFRINIGASPQEFTLQADGDLIITGSYTPDYVFEPGYPLLSLDELQDFIEENGHLPNVPSDAEVKRTRQINLSEFQLRLLEKIEELTLYTLAQHEQLQGLAVENQDLLDRLEALEQVSSSPSKD